MPTRFSNSVKREPKHEGSIPGNSSISKKLQTRFAEIGIQLRPLERHLERLRTPLGDLIPGPPERTIPKLRSIISRTKPPMVITVGDVVSREAIRGGIKVDVQIIDTKTMRKPLGLAVVPGRVKTYHVQNPAGVIRMGSWETVRNALREKNTTIVVEGEEDLLAIPSILEAPEGALVLYGQPNQGVVLVKVSGPIRDELAAMVHQMVKESA